MKDDIQSLMDLQAIDLDVQKIEEKMAVGYGALEAKKNEIESNRESITDYQEQLEIGEKRRRELEALVEDEQERIKDRQTKLMNIQTNREYQSILKEIEDTKLSNKQREEELILLLEQSESIQSKINELTDSCNASEEKLNEETVSVEKASSKLGTAMRKIEKSRTAQAKKVNGKYLKRYEMLRERRNGLAVAGVTKGVCLGCNMNIPPQMFNELLKEKEILSCPTCNRMMYHRPIEEE